MKGYLYYESKDIERNQGFIDELIAEAKKKNIELTVLKNDAMPRDDHSFIIYRGRDYQLAAEFEKMGFRVFNNSEVNRIANNKLSTFELAVMLGVPTIETHKLYMARQIEKYPVVVKTADGHGGQEVHLCHAPAEVEDVMKQYGDRLLVVQPYIESNATDIRVFVLGNEIIGAVKRTGVDSFKSNYTLGGTVEMFKVSKKIELIVEKIVDTLGSDYIGIDFLLKPNGEVVLNEIEDPVGARSLYDTHGFSVAEKLVEYIRLTINKNNE